MAERVSATPEAVALIAVLRAQHGELMFHQSGGCCDGSSPMCYPRGEFMTGDSDVRLGDIGGCPFYMSRAQFEYWQHTHLVIDVVPGRGGMFSLEGSTGRRFLTRSRLYTDAEAPSKMTSPGPTWTRRAWPHTCSRWPTPEPAPWAWFWMNAARRFGNSTAGRTSSSPRAWGILKP